MYASTAVIGILSPVIGSSTKHRELSIVQRANIHIRNGSTLREMNSSLSTDTEANFPPKDDRHCRI